MLLYREKSGYLGSQGKIQYTTSWDKTSMSRDAEIFFYPKNPDSVVDIGVSDNLNDVEVFHYPHTRKDIVNFLNKKEDEVKILLQLALEKFPGRSLFTIDAADMKIIEDDDFTCYRPSKVFKYNFFTFQGPGGAGTFPTVFMISNQQDNGSYKYVFNTQVYTSHYCLKAAQIHTQFGKNLTYILANSVERKKFIGDDVPSIDSIQFPTNGRDRIPSFLRTDALQACFEKWGLNDLKVSGDKLLLLPGPSSEEVIDAQVLENLQYVLSKDEVDNVRDRALRIQRSVLDKNEILVTELMAHGVRETFACLPAQDRIIPISLDIGGIARKMCLFQGKVYVIPVNKKTEWDVYFGADPDSFVECTEETYPTTF